MFPIVNRGDGEGAQDTDEIAVFDILFGPSGRAPGEGDHWPLHKILCLPVPSAGIKASRKLFLKIISTTIAEFSGDGKWGGRDL